MEFGYVHRASKGDEIMKYIIAIDLGATKTIVGLIRDNKIIKKLKFHTQNESYSLVLKDLLDNIDIISTNIERKNIKFIVIGVAGPVEYNQGTVINVPNIKGFKKINLKKIIESKFNIRTIIENDVKLQSLGEYSINQKSDSLFCISIGTGIGAGLVYKNQLYREMNSALEIGHMVIVANGDNCSCGNHGCLQSYCSGKGISDRYFKKFKIKLDSKKIMELSKKDKNTKEFIKETSNYLGIGLLNIINIFDPKIIVINGGLSKSKELINNAIKIARRSAMVKYKGKIVVSKLQEDALFYGAIYITK